MARIPATDKVKEAHPTAAETELLVDEKTRHFEIFVYDEKGQEIAKHWGTMA